MLAVDVPVFLLVLRDLLDMKVFTMPQIEA